MLAERDGSGHARAQPAAAAGSRLLAYWDDCVAEMTPEKVGEICDVDPQLIEDACKAWAVRIDPAMGNGGINVNLAPEQSGRAIQNFRSAFISHCNCDSNRYRTLLHDGRSFCMEFRI